MGLGTKDFIYFQSTYNKSMWDVFFSFFVITALALLFAHAWNLFAETLIETWDIKDSEGNVKDPIVQTLVYAIVMTLISIGVLWFVHDKTDIDLSEGRKMKHKISETDTDLKEVKKLLFKLNAQLSGGTTQSKFSERPTQSVQPSTPPAPDKI